MTFEDIFKEQTEEERKKCDKEMKERIELACTVANKIYNKYGYLFCDEYMHLFELDIKELKKLKRNVKRHKKKVK